LPRQISATGQASVTSSPQIIVPENLSRAGVLITNTDSTNPIYVGNADVTALTGEYVFAGNSISIPVTNEVWGVTSGPAVLITYMEVQ
jgi:hypothetical protein